MSAKRSKLIRKVALQFAPFREDVEYREITKHIKQDLREQMLGQGGQVVCDPIRLTPHCYRKRVKDTKREFAGLKQQFIGAPNKAIADMLLPA